VIDAVRRPACPALAPAPLSNRNEECSVSEVKLTAESRTEFGKGAARRLRRADKIPAVLYGHGTEPVHIALPGHATMLALKNSNALLTLDMGGSSELALPKDVQRDPIRNIIEHVDLILVRRGEKVTVEVPLHVTGKPAGDGLATSELNTLSLEVLATAIPQSVEVSVEGVVPGTQIHAGEIALPEGSTLAGDADAIAVIVAAGSVETAPEAAPEGDVVEEPAGETAGQG
jgi:large subunit ribosomal protein L25